MLFKLMGVCVFPIINFSLPMTEQMTVSLKNPDLSVLDARSRAVLSMIIEEHLSTGEPVGSKTVSFRLANAAGLSSATIRNVMGELEDSGLVEQPHTSAGRIPTDKGYRFYVDNLLGILSLSNSELNAINQQLGISFGEAGEVPENLMEKTSQLLSSLSDNVGIVVSPSLANDRLQHIKFVNLADKRILVVLVSAPQLVHNKVIRLEESFSQEELDRTANYLNAEFAGKSLRQIRQEILALMHEEKALFDRLLQTAMILCSESMEGDEEKPGEVYVDGTANILTKPDFADVARLRELIKTIEEKSRLVQILNECIANLDANQNRDVQITIGRENFAASMQNCALITAPFHIGDSSIVGTLSVLGPVRLEYARTIAVVSYVAKILERLIANESVTARN
jgi:heat-inducible transcriptional repressor